MKRLLPLLFFASCNSANPKIAIVEKQKELQYKIGVADLSISILKRNGEMLQLKTSRKAVETHSTKILESDTLQKQLSVISDSVNLLTLKKARLQGKYDSLEMELKKY